MQTIPTALKDKHEDTNKSNSQVNNIKNSSLTKHVTFKISTDEVTKNIHSDQDNLKILTHKIDDSIRGDNEVTKILRVPEAFLDTATAIFVATARQHNQLTIQDTLDAISNRSAGNNIENLSTKALNSIARYSEGIDKSVTNLIQEAVDNVGLQKIKQDFGILCKQATECAQEQNFILKNF